MAKSLQSKVLSRKLLRKEKKKAFWTLYLTSWISPLYRKDNNRHLSHKESQGTELNTVTLKSSLNVDSILCGLLMIPKPIYDSFNIKRLSVLKEKKRHCKSGGNQWFQTELNIILCPNEQKMLVWIVHSPWEVDTAKTGYQRVSTMQQPLPSHLGRVSRVRSSSWMRSPT